MCKIKMQTNAQDFFFAGDSWVNFEVQFTITGCFVCFFQIRCGCWVEIYRWKSRLIHFETFPKFYLQCLCNRAELDFLNFFLVFQCSCCLLHLTRIYSLFCQFNCQVRISFPFSELRNWIESGLLLILISVLLASLHWFVCTVFRFRSSFSFKYMSFADGDDDAQLR